MTSLSTTSFFVVAGFADTSDGVADVPSSAAETAGAPEGSAGAAVEANGDVTTVTTFAPSAVIVLVDAPSSAGAGASAATLGAGAGDSIGHP